jgi:predicted nucleotidyltransferase component of viral defense system
VFALKGGTAINLFIRDMPRLSVDLDLRWKMRNLEQLAKTSPKKFAEQANALKRLLG